MTADQMTALMAKLPKGERRKAAERVQWALKMGWTCIDVWDTAGDTFSKDSHPRICDLVGESPTGSFDFLPEIPSD